MEGSDSGSERYVVAAHVKRGESGAAEQLLAAGPPFDPDEAGLSAHEAYVGEDHVYLVFEGKDARNKAFNLARKHMLEVTRWQNIITDFPAWVEDIPPSARRVYSWRAER